MLYPDKDLSISADLLNEIPPFHAWNPGILPVAYEAETVVLVMQEEPSQQIIDTLSFTRGKQWQFRIAAADEYTEYRRDFTKLRDRYYPKDGIKTDDYCPIESDREIADRLAGLGLIDAKTADRIKEQGVLGGMSHLDPNDVIRLLKSFE